MPKKFNLSVNNTRIKSKSEGRPLTGFNVKSFDLENPDDIAMLKEIFQSNCYSINQWAKPKEEDKAYGYQGSCAKLKYVGMHGIVLDIDEPGLTIEGAKEKFKDYVYLIHTSSSHQVDIPKKGGIIDRFRIILPFEPQENDEPHYNNKKDADRLYNFLKSKYQESDSSTFERARKFYPFAGKDRSKYQFYYNVDGKYISFDPEEINKGSKKAPKKKVAQFIDNDDKIKTNVSTDEPYYSPTGEEYVMPDELITANVNNAWEEKTFQEIKELMLLQNLQKIPVYCNRGDDKNSQSASAFIYQDFKRIFRMECSHCKKEESVKQYSWREYPVSDAMFAQNKKIYEIKVRSAEHIGPHELTREEWRNAKEADFAFQYIKKNRFFLSHNFTINYYSDPELSGDMPKYELKFNDNEINIAYPIAQCETEDNKFIDDYINDVFGQYAEFIKNWLALYTYTNYESLPVLILVGGRATGKNTFVQMVGDIYNMLWAQWSGDRDNFNSYYTKKLLWIDENAFGDKKSQYDEIKFLTGNKYVTVNEKYQPRYRVRNNIKVILTANDFKPLAVKNEEAPKSDKDNNFFFYQFPDIPDDKRDRDIGNKLKQRIGYYARTELKKRYKKILDNPDTTCRYVIPCPITQYANEVYVMAKTELEYAVGEIEDHLISNRKTHVKLSELREIIKDKNFNNANAKQYLTAMQRKGIIGLEEVRTSNERRGFRILSVPEISEKELFT